MRILSFTTLYPNAAQPSHGIFVENRLSKLAASGKAEITVVAPVPWFPFASKRFGQYGTFAAVPKREERFGITVHHPRYPVIPKIGMNIAPSLMARAVGPFVKRLVRESGGFDLIDAHYFYPDGVAAVRIARELGLPVTVTARGTDLNLIPEFASPRRQIIEAAQNASHLITVCEALKQPLLNMGIPDEKITPLRNGVDLDLFRPMDREAARAKYGITGPTLLSVGGLVERKGHHLIMQALTRLPRINLLIAGDGPERRPLEELIIALELTDRVRILGHVPHQELPTLYSAADILVLASDREGWANVLLESMACGTPVVATNIWGTGEVVRAPAAGLLIDARTPDAIIDATGTLLADPPSREATRAYAERFSWDETTRGQLAIFSRLIG